MTEPPRPPGESDPAGAPGPPPGPPPYSTPAEPGPAGPPPPPGPTGTGYPPPEGGYPPPESAPGGGYPPPGYPPPGGYPPGGGYPPPGQGYYGAGGVPPGYANSDEKTWALIAHFGGAVGALFSWGTFGWVAPLVSLLAKGQQSPTVRAHAVAALNFQLLWAIISFVALVLGGCLIWLILPGVLFLVPLIPIILGVIGGVRANEGQLYRYPMSVSWIS